MPAPELALAQVLEAGVIGAQDATADWARTMLASLKLSISKPSPPRSVPWDPPGMETGYLFRSYSCDVKKATVTVASLETYAFYAHYLEWGTRYMAPRPHFRPAVAAHLPLLTPAVAHGIVAAERAKARELGGSG